MQKAVLFIITFLIIIPTAWAGLSDSTYTIVLDPLVLDEQDQPVQDLYIKIPPFTESKLEALKFTIVCYDITKEKDSVLVYRRSGKAKVNRKNGVVYTHISYSSKESNLHFTPLYKDILLKNAGLPAGIYRTLVQIEGWDTVLARTMIRQVDSTLAVQSASKKELEMTYAPNRKNGILGTLISSNTSYQRTQSALTTVKNATKKIDKAFAKKGMNVNYRHTSTKTFVDVYYLHHFVGYYEIDMEKSLRENIQKQQQRLTDNITSEVKNELENSKTVFNQIKGLYEENKKKEIQGNISLTGYAANGQEENSQDQNNYYEVAGQVEVPIMNIPLNIEGYYTSQDKYRTAKASYLRLHYDTQQAKAELMKLISGYKGKYEEALSKGKGLDGVYTSYINKLKTQENKILDDLYKETGVANLQHIKIDTAGFLNDLSQTYEQKLTDSLNALSDSVQDNNTTYVRMTKNKDSIMQIYSKAMKKYEQVKELERKIQHSFRAIP